MSEGVSRERLIEMIEAYAAAKVTQNNTLISLSVAALTQLIDAVLTPKADDFSTPDEKPRTPRRTS